MRLRTRVKEDGEIRDCSPNPTDENAPINSSDDRTRYGNPGRTRGPFLRRSCSATGSRRATASRGASSQTTSSEVKKVIKKSGEKGSSVLVAAADSSTAASAGVSSVGKDKSLDGSKAGNVVSKISRINTRSAYREHNVEQSASEERNVERLGVAHERTGDDQVSTSNNKAAAPKVFYGRAAVSMNAGDPQQLLQRFSFSRELLEESPTVTAPKNTKKRGKARPGVPKAKRKMKKNADGAPPDDVDNKFSRLPGTTYHLSLVRESFRLPLKSRKFFKHSAPRSQFLCKMVGGVAKLFPLSPQDSLQGKKDKISHLAENWAECDNLSLRSVDDVPKESTPIVSMTQNERPNLPKRKSTIGEDQKSPKRRRWSKRNLAAEEETPVGQSSAEPKSAASAIGPTDTVGQPKTTARVNEEIGGAQPRPKRVETSVTRGTPNTDTKRAALAEEGSASKQPRLQHSGNTNDFRIASRNVARAFIPLRKRVALVRGRRMDATHEQSTFLTVERERDRSASPTNSRDQIGQPEVPAPKDDGVGVERPERKQSVDSSDNRDSVSNRSIMKRSTLSDRASRCRTSRQKSVRFSDSNNGRRPLALQESGTQSFQNPITIPIIIVNNLEKESSPAATDASHCFSPIPCESPCLSPSPPPPTDPCPSPESEQTQKQSLSAIDPETTNPVTPYDPRQDAFGFDRRHSKARPVQNPFVEVHSPEKMPKELMPKIMTRTRSQPLIGDALKNANNKVVSSTPMKTGIGRLSNQMGASSPTIKAKTLFTSTPWDPTRRRGFYGASSSSTTDTDGFKGLRRLIDRMGQKQLQIDAGQKKYGAEECKTCGMIYSQGEAEDEREHQRFHKQMSAVLQFKSLNGCYVVDVLPDVGRAVLVSFQHSKHLKEKLSLVVDFANKLVGLDSEVVLADFARYPERVFIIFVHDSGKIVSVIGGEPCRLAYRTVPGEGIVVDTSKRHAVKNSIFFIWTLPEFRRKGLAALLLYRLRVILRAKKEPLTFDELAFADLTPDLHKFVTGLSGQDTVLVAAPPDPNLEALL